MSSALLEWGEVLAWLERNPGAEASIRKGSIAHPGELGAARSVGLPRGQRSDWRFAPDGRCRGLHVREFRSHYRAHLDQVHPQCSLAGHFFRDVLPARWAFIDAIDLSSTRGSPAIGIARADELEP